MAEKQWNIAAGWRSMYMKLGNLAMAVRLVRNEA